MKYWIAVGSALFALIIFGLRIEKSVALKQNLTGYLKQAADANTIELAEERLGLALNYLEAEGLTEGHTSVWYETPDEDIGFWYRNLKASHRELQSLKSSSALERTNVLLKLRETLLDGGEKDDVTVPDGLAVYPHNLLWGSLMIAALIAGFIAFAITVAISEQKRLAAEANKSDAPTG